MKSSIPKKRPSRNAGETPPSAIPRLISDMLQLAQLRAEKCELAEARRVYDSALELARRSKDLRSMMEALAGLLRLASEALDQQALKRWDRELDQLMREHPQQVPPMAWYCKGAVARYQGQLREAQRFIHEYLRSVRRELGLSHPLALALASAAHSPGLGLVAGRRENELHREDVVKGWLMLAILLWQRGKLDRAEGLARGILARTGIAPIHVRGAEGFCSLVLANVAERRRDYEEALSWYQRAHGAFLGEHHWYYHLYVLFGYAKIARHTSQYSQAAWYLDLVERACTDELAQLRQEVFAERTRLSQDAVDLFIDVRKGLVRTRESSQIDLGKQYVLLSILEALAQAHGRAGNDSERALSKAEIIERVWGEVYRPEAHDNKLYYNINRLRKLIEPDVRKPRYLMNWKEGYRLAPGLRVHCNCNVGAGPLPNGVARAPDAVASTPTDEVRVIRTKPGLRTGVLKGGGKPPKSVLSN